MSELRESPDTTMSYGEDAGSHSCQQSRTSVICSYASGSTGEFIALRAFLVLLQAGSKNRKQFEKKLNLSINSPNRVEMSVCYINDNKRNLVLTSFTQPAQVLMCEITQGEKT